MNLRRKRYVLMNSGVWKGHIRNISGNPVTLDNAMGLQTLEVLGNSIQDGTPSPDNPVDVVGVGEKTLNSFDVSQITSKSGGYTDSNKIYVRGYSFSAGITPERFMEITGLKIGDTFTCLAQYQQLQSYSSGTRYICFVPRHTDVNTFILFDYNSSVNRNNGFKVVTIPEDFSNDNYYGLYFYGGNTTNAIDGEARAVWSNFAIYKGSYTADTLPPYEPYGYKVPVSIEGRNLFDANGIVSNTDDTYLNIIEYENINCLSWIDGGSAHYQRNMQGYFKENTQYTFSFTGYSKKTISIYIHYTDSTYSIFTIKCDGTWSRQIATSKVGKTIDYWSGGNNYAQRVYIDLAQSQIIEGAYTAETMPPYEPYKEPQMVNIYTPQILHGLGDVSDTVVLDFDNRIGYLVKKTGILNIAEVTKIYSFGEYGTTGMYHQCFVDGYTMAKGIGMSGLCNVLPEDKSWFITNYEHVHFGQSNAFIYVITQRKYTVSEVDKLKSYLTNNGQTDAYCIYPLATPATTDISDLQDWDNMPDISGTIILTADSTAKPNLNVSYYSTTKE